MSLLCDFEFLSPTLLLTCHVCRPGSQAPVPSLAEMRSQIPCKLYDYGNGFCEYGASCYYKHCTREGQLLEKVVDSPHCYGFWRGLFLVVSCKSWPPLQMGSACLSVHLTHALYPLCFSSSCAVPLLRIAIALSFASPHPMPSTLSFAQTGSMTSLNRLRFQNPYGEGDICAAGIIPFTYTAVPEQYRAEGAVWALLQVRA